MESSVARRRGPIERFVPPDEARGARARLADRATSETRLTVSRGGHTVCKGSARGLQRRLQGVCKASAQASPQGSPQGQSARPAKTWRTRAREEPVQGDVSMLKTTLSDA
jgi:hypothetical protein